jgi:DNA repair protein SbcD/Mre11
MVGLRFLHPNIFKRLQESTFQAFKNLVDLAIAHQVDFVILAGDLFDNENRSIRAQVFLRKEMERLEQEGIDVFLVHGNHDHLGGNWTEIKWPSNVHVFGEQVEVKKFETKNQTIVHLYGFSYPERHVLDRKINDYHLVTGADFHIGILHGNMEGNQEHGNYAPFHISELLEKEFHYWALGHIHKRALLHEEPPILYPGNTQGRHKKETEVKGCYLVNLNESGAELLFSETSDVVWKEIEIDAANCYTFNELYQLVQESIESERIDGKGVIANINIVNLSLDAKDISSGIDELLEMIQEDEKDMESFVWPNTMDVQEQVYWEKEELAKSSTFYEELFEVMGQFDELEKMLSPLYKHPNARKLLTPLTESEQNELVKEAQTLLIERLLRNG